MKCDVLIIGAGPAGLTAAMYSARANMKTVVAEKLAAGGQLAQIPVIENYPGAGKIGGFDLAQQFRDQAVRLGAEIISASVLDVIPLENGRFDVRTDSGSVDAGAVIIATGAKKSKLGIEGEKELTGSGVSYCATCDGSFFKGMDTAVVGGNAAAVEDAVYLSGLCGKVYLVYRASEEIEKAKENGELPGNIILMPNTVATGIRGMFAVEGLTVSHIGGESETLAVSGVFISVGTEPVVGFAPEGVRLDQKGYIITNDLATDVPGIFAAGDVVSGNMKQVVVAASDGAKAAEKARLYAKKHRT
ncbi:MAG: FAD-dependent oxidoreductase [Clostridiales bacterium]|nr:FAD-dependent oxidoreductase [Clostridiales bacterium]